MSELENQETKRRGRPPAAKPEAVEPRVTVAPIADKPASRAPMADHVEFVTLYETHKRLGRRPVFSNADFAGLKLVGHNLPAADFINCSFAGAEFRNCVFQGWMMSGCEGQPILENCDTRFGNYLGL